MVTPKTNSMPHPTKLTAWNFTDSGKALRLGCRTLAGRLSLTCAHRPIRWQLCE